MSFILTLIKLHTQGKMLLVKASDVLSVLIPLEFSWIFNAIGHLYPFPKSFLVFGFCANTFDYDHSF